MSPTTDRTRQGLTIGAAALAVSVAGDILERTVPERLGLALGIGALVLAIGYVLAREPELDAPHPGFASNGGRPERLRHIGELPQGDLSAVVAVDEQPANGVERAPLVVAKTDDEIVAALSLPDLRSLFADEADTHGVDDVAGREADASGGITIDGDLQLRQPGQLLRTHISQAIDVPDERFGLLGSAVFGMAGCWSLLVSFRVFSIVVMGPPARFRRRTSALALRRAAIEGSRHGSTWRTAPRSMDHGGASLGVGSDRNPQSQAATSTRSSGGTPCGMK